MYRTGPSLRGLYRRSGGLWNRVWELRRELAQKRSAGAPPLFLLSLESQLLLELGNSARPEECEEALWGAEGLWRLLEDRQNTPLPAPSRTAMRVALCTTMRRCALRMRKREASELWTERFAQRAARLRPEDFIQDEEEMQGWEKTMGTSTPRGSTPFSNFSQGRPDSGTRFTDEDLEKGSKADDSGASKSEDVKGKNQFHQTRKTLSPMQKHRQDIMMDHPLVTMAFKRHPDPGPRYTD
ncbi:unnamed protein product [Phytomonas sp. Hart1]|nr:unnamed protein product [Phytomonas sp. Hart1]|eukprot:CCW70942.1 unnamed protein product [Phytomonas sp. isolate Hart1]